MKYLDKVKLIDDYMSFTKQYECFNYEIRPDADGDIDYFDLTITFCPDSQKPVSIDFRLNIKDGKLCFENRAESVELFEGEIHVWREIACFLYDKI